MSVSIEAVENVIKDGIMIKVQINSATIAKKIMIDSDSTVRYFEGFSFLGFSISGELSSKSLNG